MIVDDVPRWVQDLALVLVHAGTNEWPEFISSPRQAPRQTPSQLHDIELPNVRYFLSLNAVETNGPAHEEKLFQTRGLPWADMAVDTEVFHLISVQIRLGSRELTSGKVKRVVTYGRPQRAL